MFSRNAAIVASCVMIAIAGTAGAQDGKVGLTVSKETTYVTSPLSPNGTIDYVEAYNELRGKGVSPEDNAARDLAMAIGPRLFPKETARQIRHVLGLPENFEERKGFVPIDEFADSPASATRMLLRATSIPWSPRMMPELAKWINANDALLDAVAKAVEKDRYFMPMVPHDRYSTIEDALGPDMEVYRRVAQALACRGTMRAASRDVDGGWADIMAASRLGRLVASEATMESCIVGVHMDTDAANAVRGLLIRNTVPADKAGAFLSAIDALPAPCDLPKAVDVGARMHQLSLAMVLANAGPEKADELVLKAKGPGEGAPTSDEEWRWVRAMINWDTVTRSLNARCDALRDLARVGEIGKRGQALKSMWAEYNDLCSITTSRAVSISAALAAQKRMFQAVTLALLQDPSNDMTALSSRITSDVTNLMLCAYIPPVLSAMAPRDGLRASWTVNKVALALEAYKSAKGSYPDKLSSLKVVDEDLDIEDPCADDTPLHYWRDDDGYMLYSIGPNRKDDGGSSDERKSHDDIAVKRR